MTENESSHPTESIPPLILDIIIEEEVLKDIAPILEEDPETAEFLRSIMADYRQNSYDFLRWVDKTYNPQNVLYPASGFDAIPKNVFGQARVVHTSLENYRGDDRTYFPELGEGKKVVADNKALPFRDSSFQTILLLDSSADIIAHDVDEFNRTLTKGGLVVLSRTVLTEDTFEEREQMYLASPHFEALDIPEQFQQQGASETTFYLLRKT